MPNEKIKLYQGDCLWLMKDYDDNYFDLAIVDPNYGVKASRRSKNKSHVKTIKRIARFNKTSRLRAKKIGTINLQI